MKYKPGASFGGLRCESRDQGVLVQAERRNEPGCRSSGVPCYFTTRVSRVLRTVLPLVACSVNGYVPGTRGRAPIVSTPAHGR